MREVLNKNGDAITALIALAAIGIAWWQIAETRWAQQVSTAYDTYRDYLRLAFENPDFGSPEELLRIDYAQRTIAGERAKFDQYEWFVALMLHGYAMMLSVSDPLSSLPSSRRRPGPSQVSAGRYDLACNGPWLRVDDDVERTARTAVFVLRRLVVGPGLRRDDEHLADTSMGVAGRRQ